MSCGRCCGQADGIRFNCRTVLATTGLERRLALRYHADDGQRKAYAPGFLSFSAVIDAVVLRDLA